MQNVELWSKFAVGQRVGFRGSNVMFGRVLRVKADVVGGKVTPTYLVQWRDRNAKGKTDIVCEWELGRHLESLGGYFKRLEAAA
jgi:hypothetical protein